MKNAAKTGKMLPKRENLISLERRKRNYTGQLVINRNLWVGLVYRQVKGISSDTYHKYHEQICLPICAHLEVCVIW